MDNRSPYKTAADLKIEQWEHDGLVALIGPLSRGELAYDQGEYEAPGPDNWSDCGTAMCIGGWLAFNEGRNTRDYVCGYQEQGALRGLFWGHIGGDLTSEQGARAIVNFLTLGDPRWDDVMREPA